MTNKHAQEEPRNPSQRSKVEALRAYSRDPAHPACQTCGEDDLVTLTLSHMSPFTKAEIAEAKRIHRPRLRGSTLRGWLKRQGWPHDPKITDIAVECLNCNVKRGWGDGGWGPDGRRRRPPHSRPDPRKRPTGRS